VSVGELYTKMVTTEVVEIAGSSVTLNGARPRTQGREHLFIVVRSTNRYHQSIAKATLTDHK
jgi:hypothetical protein